MRRTAPIRLPAEPRAILLVKPSALGDVVHALPALALLRRRWPAARIDWLVNAPFAGLLESHPCLDGVVRFERAAWRRAWGLPALMGALRGARYDLAIDLQGLARSALLSAWTGAATIAGFAAAREGAPLLYTDRVAGGGERHAVERCLDVVDALGCGREPVQFALPREPSAEAWAQATLPAAPFAALLPGTNWPTKRWPAERFAALVRPLRERFGLSSVLAGGADATALAGRIPADLDLTGRTTLPQLVALLRRAALVVTNDSGPMHLAAALDRPMVALFGPTSPIRTGPYRRDDAVLRLEMPCAPCFSRRCLHTSCMAWLEADAALRAAERQLARWT